MSCVMCVAYDDELFGSGGGEAPKRRGTAQSHGQQVQNLHHHGTRPWWGAFQQGLQGTVKGHWPDSTSSSLSLPWTSGTALLKVGGGKLVAMGGGGRCGAGNGGSCWG